MSDTLVLNTTDTTNILGKPYNVIIFNDESHSMDEVARQIDKATHCGVGKAAAIMMEAHIKGRAICFSGSLERCELVESILAEIRLGTKIEQA